MKHLHHIFKIGIFIFVLAFFIIMEDLHPLTPLIYVVTGILHIIYEKYRRHPAMLVLQLGFLIWGFMVEPGVMFLFLAWTYDAVRERHWYAVILPVYLAFANFPVEQALPYTLLFLLVAFSAYSLSNLMEKEKRLQKAFDQERAVRFQLEKQKGELMASNRKIEELTAASERSRIAGEIHDHIGHRIAGILMQLQVVEKVMEGDPELAKTSVKESWQKLSRTLELLRETVHNIKPKERTGILYLEDILKEYPYLKTDLYIKGDSGRVPSHYVELMGVNLKEALTNATKHGKADRLEVRVEVLPRFVRFSTRDNGRGKEKITLDRGLGLKGMKERVEALGGSISFSGKEGFQIVSILPLKGTDEEGET